VVKILILFGSDSQNDFICAGPGIPALFVMLVVFVVKFFGFEQALKRAWYAGVARTTGPRQGLQRKSFFAVKPQKRLERKARFFCPPVRTKKGALIPLLFF
jgi:hypothetical protein